MRKKRPPNPPYLAFHEFRVGVVPPVTNLIGAYAIPTEEMAKTLRDDVNAGLTAVSDFLVQCHPVLGTIEGGLAFNTVTGGRRCVVVGNGLVALLLAGRLRPGTKLLLLDKLSASEFDKQVSAFVNQHTPKTEGKQAEAKEVEPTANIYVASALVSVGPETRTVIDAACGVLSRWGLRPNTLLRAGPTIVFAVTTTK